MASRHVAKCSFGPVTPEIVDEFKKLLPVYGENGDVAASEINALTFRKGLERAAIVPIENITHRVVGAELVDGELHVDIEMLIDVPESVCRTGVRGVAAVSPAGTHLTKIHTIDIFFDNAE